MRPEHPEPPTPVTVRDVEDAARVLNGIARRTPVESSTAVTRAAGAETVLMKCENLQRIGAFKFRGACNALSRLPENHPGVLAYSSGNHAQAVALSAGLLGLRAIIVMPANAPAVKRSATERLLQDAAPGSEVVFYNPKTQIREQLGAEIAEREGLEIVPPYDHPHVIAGQGTAALELFEEAGTLDRLYVCTGGGGLLSGSALVAKDRSPGCTVIGVEPEAGDDATRSFETRTLQKVSNPDTIADGARTPYLGSYTFPLVLSHVDRMMTVTDAELAAAMRLVYERARLVIEPTGALALAGAIKDGRDGALRGKRVGVILSGGNVDLDKLGYYFALAASPD